ncbi:MAG: 23S rRNA (pseudouridine(1915)-N(3))-methyltransferase RlmH [Gemmatimonadetes bacterium]|nr:23S rRNA (pseudouridine(1915)-N(3))-methyltransferase RlmH [Gemmatimonadota bacterium]
MRLWVGVVGRPGALFAGAIAEYERRAGRYWGLDIVEVREAKAHKGVPVAEVRAAESRRLLERVPPGYEIVALTREGEAWSSGALAKHLQEVALRGGAGVAFLIGGAYGLDEAARRRARHCLSLSSFTLPHELARLVLAEQLYRAGTIVRGEPYHKAAE